MHEHVNIHIAESFVGLCMNEWMNEAFYIALYCVLLYTQSALQSYEGVSLQPPPVCKHPLGWCDGSHRTTAPVRSPHTSYRWRGERDRANQVDGDYWEAWLTKASGGNLESGHLGYTPTLYDECHGIFNDHRESRPRFNVSSERRCSFDSIVSPSLYWGVRTHTDHRVSTPCWPH